MAVLTEESAAEKSNFKNSRGNGYGLRLRQRHFSGSVLTATTTTRKTDQDTATTATEKTTLNQVHSGPKTGSTSKIPCWGNKPQLNHGISISTHAITRLDSRIQLVRTSGYAHGLQILA